MRRFARAIATVLGSLLLTTELAFTHANSGSSAAVAINRDFCDSRHSLD
jgi:hypothetical protein